MTRVNRISALRPPVAISRMPEQEIAFLKEQMRQRAEIEEKLKLIKVPMPKAIWVACEQKTELS